MRLTSWLSTWTRRLVAPRQGRNVRERNRSRAFPVADFARVATPLETLEPRLVLDGTLANDLAAFAKTLRDNGVTLYGAAWDATTTAQRQLFGDGSQFLNFVEVTNANHTLNSTATTNNITTTSPTWIFSNGSRLTGTQTLAALALQLSTVVSTIPNAIPQGFTPGLAPIATQTLLAGSPLLLPLDGFDPNNDDLTYSVTLSNNTANLSATLRPRNGALKFSVAGYGDMLIDTFDDLVPRVTEHIKQLAQDNFYDGVIFHRVINNFVIQGGDPTGTGTGGSTLRNFDDQFHVDLQHNRTGLISMAKTTDDTNDSQFFLTEGPQRHLDFNHSIFGLIVEGESVRDAISNTAANANGVPTFTITMQSVDVVADNENSVLMLKVPNGATGGADVKVRVTDPNGNFSERTFRVNVQADSASSNPFLDDIPLIRTLQNTPISFTVHAADADGQTPLYLDQATLAGNQLAVPYTTNPANLSYSVGFNSGLTTVTPVSSFAGSEKITIATGVRPSAIDYQVVPIEVVATATDLSLSAHNDPSHGRPNNAIADATNDGQGDAFSVRLVPYTIGSTTRNVIEVSINGKVAQLAEVNSVQTLIINGSNDTDSLTIDFGNGNPFPAGGIQFNGGGQTNGGKDQLIVKNYAGQLLNYTLTSAHDGTLSDTTSNGTRTLVTFTGLESINDSLTSTNRSVQFAATGGSALLAVDPSVAGQWKLDFGTDLGLNFKAPTNAMTVIGGAGADTLSVSYADGSPIAPGGVIFQGGTQPASGVNTRDQLVVTGTTAATILHTVTNATDGSITVNGANVITYNGTESVVDELAVTDRSFQFGDSADTVVLSDDGVAGDGKSKLSYGTKEFVFANSAGSLVINGGNGNDSLTATGLDSSFPTNANLFLQGQLGNDTIKTSAASRPFLMVGGDGNDSLIGTALPDVIDGGAGNDTINGRGGNDTLSGGAGDDVLDGGAGDDVLSEATTGNGSITVTTTQIQGGTPLGTDTYTSIASMTFTGGALANKIDTRLFSGNVTLLGGDGADTLISGNGNDNLQGQGGDDVLTGGAGNDFLDGGNGDVDRLIETFNTNWLLTNTTLSGLGSDTLNSFEQASLTGGAGSNTLDAHEYTGNATLNGAAGSDILIGGIGNDSLDGGPGNNDRLTGGGGLDNLNGGAGVDDWLIESGNAPLIKLTKTTLSGISPDTDTISGFENAMLTGGDGDNTINASDFAGSVSLAGGGGRDALSAGAGAATLDGGNGNDTLTGGQANDALVGGDGNDLILETGNGNLTATANADVPQLIGGAVFGTDTYTGIEALQLTGGTAANVFDLKLFDGSVTLDGGSGNDSLTGTSVNDLLIGGNGNDSLVGNAGLDTLTGDSGNDVLKGGLGNDKLSGGAGNDTLNGGDGNDTLDGGVGSDGLSGSLGDDLLMGKAGNDTLVGSEGNDTLMGGNDKDLLMGGQGADSVNGEDGIDTVTAGAGNGAAPDAGDVVVDLSEISNALKIVAAWIDAV